MAKLFFVVFVMLSLLSLDNELFFPLTIAKIVFGIIGYCLLYKTFPKNKYIFSLFFYIVICNVLPNIIAGELTLRDIAINFYPIGVLSLFIFFYKANIKKAEACLYFVSGITIMLALFLEIYRMFDDINTSSVMGINRNSIQLYVLFSLSFLCVVYDKRKIENREEKGVLFFAFIALITMILSRSATSFVTVMVIIPILAKYKSVKLLHIILGYVTAFILIAKSFSNNIIVIQFIQNFFQKTDTFTNRMWRWKYAFDILKEDAWIGQSNILELAKDYSHVSELSYFNPHNALLNILLYSGVIGLVGWFFLIHHIYKKSLGLGISNRFIIILLCGNFIIGLMESNFSLSNFSLMFIGVLPVIYQNKFGKDKHEKVYQNVSKDYLL